jgi:hypothetical protein
MKYNDLITYNHNNITYNGTIYINVPGLSNPIILNNITVVVATEPDYSNATTVGVVTFDLAPSGIMTIEATDEQAYAISESSTIYLVPSSETSSTEIFSAFEGSTEANLLISNGGEISIESV